ncbi:hypothetical protein [Amycolatopsis taiwanensis]|uniref:hypothetical protein n=1 Tax=Amycolatopsis taiwanensis TaxID=342230 RepID=UPI00255414CD|nr:hypothetical protein [Amycolatopsis taiwanensis]
MRIKSRFRTIVALSAFLSTSIIFVSPTAGAAEAEPITSAWQLSFLPLPDGHPDATGHVTGSDGKGGYSGFLDFAGKSQVVIWKDGEITVAGVPAGYDFAATHDENNSGTIVGEALDFSGAKPEQAFLLGDAGFQFLPIPQGFDRTDATAINNRGDVVGQAFNATDPAKDAIVLWPAADRQPRHHSTGPLLRGAGGPRRRRDDSAVHRCRRATVAQRKAVPITRAFWLQQHVRTGASEWTGRRVRELAGESRRPGVSLAWHTRRREGVTRRRARGGYQRVRADRRTHLLQRAPHHLAVDVSGGRTPLAHGLRQRLGRNRNMPQS